jgi:hypothetical protein
MTQAEYIEKIRKNIKVSSSELDDNDLITALNNALSELTRDVPLIKTANFNSNESMKYPLPADWEEGFSYIQCVEFTNTDTDATEYLEESEYKIYSEADVPYLEIMKDYSEEITVILHYSIQYKIDDGNNNVKGSYVSALVWLSCSHAAFMLSQKYSYLLDSDFNADISLKSRSAKIMEISNKYRTMYGDQISKIIFGHYSRAYLTTKNHNSDVFGENKMFH